MKIKVQMVMIGEDGKETTRDVVCMERDELTPETLGVSLAEGKTTLKSIQEIFVEWQMDSSNFTAHNPRCTSRTPYPQLLQKK